MPTYEYLCQECGQEFEAFQSMKDDPLTDCQLCGAESAVKRKIGRGAGIIFKGSGFYETDFKDRKGSPSAASSFTGSSTASSSKESSSGGADTNSGKKSESKPSSSTPAAASD